VRKREKETRDESEKLRLNGKRIKRSLNNAINYTDVPNQYELIPQKGNFLAIFSEVNEDSSSKM